MERASPVELRKAIAMANALIEAGLSFVPVPVLDDADREALVAQAMARMDTLASEVEG